MLAGSGSGYKTATIPLPSKYTPKQNMAALGCADFSAQFSMYVELKTDGKLYLAVSYTNGMNSYGVNKFGTILYF